VRDTLDPSHLQRICAALGISPEKIQDCRRDDTGLNNENWILSTAQGSWLYRIPGRGTQLFCSRRNESKVYTILRPFELSDEVIFLDAESGWKLSVYYPDCHAANPHKAQDVQAAMQLLTRLHQLPIRFPYYDDHAARIQRYFRIAKAHQAAFDPEFEPLRHEILDRIALMAGAEKWVPSHGDFLPENVLCFPDGHALLLDWEFAAMGHPLEDIGTICHHADLSPESSILTAETYFSRELTPAETNRLFLSCASAAILWYSWAIFKLTVSSNTEIYHRFAQRSLTFCARYLRLIET